METHVPTIGEILQNGLSQPFGPLTLRRSMKLFPTSLGLQPFEAGLPSDDFLANFLSGRQTYLAIIRRGFGKDFKNFQNYALKKVETTPDVRERLLQAVDGSESLLDALATGMRDGVLAQQLAQLIRAAEGAVYQAIRTLSSGSLKCAHCQAELISRPMLWWGQQSCELGEAEYRFVDRILYDVLATTMLPLLFRSNWVQRERYVADLAAMCNPGAHVFRNWLDFVRSAYRAKDLAALATRAGLSGPSPDSHLQRCGRGEMLTAETIHDVTARLPNPQPLRNLAMRTRALAFAIDFLVAADSAASPLEWSAAQAIVRARILRLFQDLQLGLMKDVRRTTATVSADRPT